MSAKYSTGVYQIRNLVNGKRYVGSTAKGFAYRWRAHRWQLRNGKHRNRYLQGAWNKYGESAFAFEVLLICGPQDVLAYEQRCIDAFCSANRKHGYNSAPVAGTSLGIKRSSEVRAKLSAMRRGVKRGPHSQQHRDNIGAAHRGKKLSQEQIEVLRRANKGRPHTSEHRAKNSAAHKGLVRSPEHCAKIAASKFGKKHPPKSPEQAAELSERLSRLRRGRIKSPEHRAKLAAANRGKPFSPDRKAKISASLMGKKLSQHSIAKRSATRRARRLAAASNQKCLF